MALGMVCWKTFRENVIRKRLERKGACWVLGGDSQRDLYNHTWVPSHFGTPLPSKTSDLQ